MNELKKGEKEKVKFQKDKLLLENKLVKTNELINDFKPGEQERCTARADARFKSAKKSDMSGCRHTEMCDEIESEYNKLKSIYDTTCTKFNEVTWQLEDVPFAKNMKEQNQWPDHLNEKIWEYEFKVA